MLRALIHADRIRAHRGAALALGAALLGGCGTLGNGRGWGQDATIAPGWERVRAAALKNLEHPMTWGPILGAGVLQLDDFNQRIWEWAKDEQPVFGSTDTALEASDEWREISDDLWIASVLATKSGDDFGSWTWSKTKGAAVEVVAKGASGGLTNVFKEITGRDNPNGDDRIYPSGHATDAWASAALASRNLDATDLPVGLRLPTRIGLYSVAAVAGWARIESGDHYPADVLFTTGMTNFVVGFFHDAFLGLDANPQLSVGLNPDVDAWEVGLAWKF